MVFAPRSGMLRITVSTQSDGDVVIVEGRLGGAWVDELRACWHSLVVTRVPASIRIDLNAVTFIDAAGKALLSALHEQGATLAANDVMTREIVDQIAGTTSKRRRQLG